MIGKIIKIHSDFYYIKTEENKILECKIREKLKKEKTEIFVGDAVVFDEKSNAITEILPRKNFLPRPSVANVDQIIIVAALQQPELDFVQLNRYLCHAKLYDLDAVICINKSDLDINNELKQKIFDIYTKLGYKVVFTSALTGMGIDELKKLPESKFSVLCGMSGVGKSSLLNRLHPELNLRTKEISSKNEKGTHTTRHVEILEINTCNGNSMQIADTPGFSCLKFDTVMPSVVNELFDEIKELSTQCCFSDCLHISETGCNVLANLDKINADRYESYKIFVQEATEYKEKLYREGYKREKSYKTLDTGKKEKKQLVKLSVEKRKKARNTEKQKLSQVSILNEVYYNQEEY